MDQITEHSPSENSGESSPNPTSFPDSETTKFSISHNGHRSIEDIYIPEDTSLLHADTGNEVVNLFSRQVALDKQAETDILEKLEALKIPSVLPQSEELQSHDTSETRSDRREKKDGILGGMMRKITKRTQEGTEKNLGENNPFTLIEKLQEHPELLTPQDQEMLLRLKQKLLNHEISLDTAPEMLRDTIAGLIIAGIFTPIDIAALPAAASVGGLLFGPAGAGIALAVTGLFVGNPFLAGFAGIGRGIYSEIVTEHRIAKNREGYSNRTKWNARLASLATMTQGGYILMWAPSMALMDEDMSSLRKLVGKNKNVLHGDDAETLDIASLQQYKNSLGGNPLSRLKQATFGKDAIKDSYDRYRYAAYQAYVEAFAGKQWKEFAFCGNCNTQMGYHDFFGIDNISELGGIDLAPAFYANQDKECPHCHVAGQMNLIYPLEKFQEMLANTANTGGTFLILKKGATVAGFVSGFKIETAEQVWDEHDADYVSRPDYEEYRRDHLEPIHQFIEDGSGGIIYYVDEMGLRENERKGLRGFQNMRDLLMPFIEHMTTGNQELIENGKIIFWTSINSNIYSLAKRVNGQILFENGTNRVIIGVKLANLAKLVYADPRQLRALLKSEKV